MEDQQDSKTWVALIAIIGSGLILIVLATFLVIRAMRGAAQQAELGLTATAAELMTLNAPVTPNFATAIPTPSPQVTPTEAAAEGDAPAGEGIAPAGDGAQGAQPTSASAADTGTDDDVDPFSDQHDTVFSSGISIGESASGTIASSFDAHNWTFSGNAGQTLTIRVAGQGSMDPILTLWGPDYSRLSYNDDTASGTDAQITVTLPSTGTYIARVRCWVTGAYTITLE